MRSMVIGLLVSSLTAVAAVAQAAGWDGTWGRSDQVQVIVKGKNVSYSYQGKPYPVSDVKMDAGHLSFRFGDAGKTTMTMNPDRTAQFDGAIGAKPVVFKIWRGS